MNAGHRLAAAAAALALVAAPALAADGIVIAHKITNGDKTSTTSTQIEKTRLRTEADMNGRKAIILFDTAGGGVLRTVDEQNKTYTELTRADVDRIASQMSGAMAQMQAQMQSLPPEQRARVEAMMQAGRGMMGAIAGPPPQYTKVGTDTFGKWRCDKYEVTRNNEKSAEMCTVEASALGFTAADFDAAAQLAQFFAIEPSPTGTGSRGRPWSSPT